MQKYIEYSNKTTVVPNQLLVLFLLVRKIYLLVCVLVFFLIPTI